MPEIPPKKNIYLHWQQLLQKQPGQANLGRDESPWLNNHVHFGTNMLYELFLNDLNHQHLCESRAHESQTRSALWAHRCVIGWTLNEWYLYFYISFSYYICLTEFKFNAFPSSYQHLSSSWEKINVRLFFSSYLWKCPILQKKVPRVIS